EREPVVSIDSRARGAARAAREREADRDRRRPPWDGLRDDLLLQPAAADALARLVRDLDGEAREPRAGRPPPLLLLRPSRTGKSRALALAAAALRPRPVLRLEPAAGPVRSLLATPREGGQVLLVDALERFAPEPRLLDELGIVLERMDASPGSAPFA